MRKQEFARELSLSIPMSYYRVQGDVLYYFKRSNIECNKIMRYLKINCNYNLTHHGIQQGKRIINISCWIWCFYYTINKLMEAHFSSMDDVLTLIFTGSLPLVQIYRLCFDFPFFCPLYRSSPL